MIASALAAPQIVPYVHQEIAAEPYIHQVSQKLVPEPDHIKEQDIN